MERKGIMFKAKFFSMIRVPNIAISLIAVVAFIVASVFVPYFFSFRNISNILISASSTGVMAIGLTLVMISGGIDLSCPASLAMSATLGCHIMVTTGNVFLGIIVALGVATATGFVNGIATGIFGMIPMVATLAVATMCSGFTNWFTQTQTITGMPELFHTIFSEKLFGISSVVYYYVFMIIVSHLVLTKTTFGRSLYAVGTNQRVAEVNGVDPKKLKIVTYTLAGAIYGLGGMLAAARVGGAGVSLGPQSNFTDVVTVVVLGGTSVLGGKGSIAGTFIASIIVAIVSNVMNLVGVGYYFSLIIKGVIVLVISFVDVVRYRTQGDG